MSIEQAAVLYVSVVEPALRALFFFVIVVMLLYGINLLRDSKKKGEFVNILFSLIINTVKKVVTWTGLLVVWLGKVLLKTLTVIFAAVRDFFTSKI